MKPEQGVLPIGNEIEPLEHRAPDAIERFILKREHSDISGELLNERVIVSPKDARENFEAYQLPQLGDGRIRYNKEGKIFIKRFGPQTIQVSLPNHFPSEQLGYDSIKNTTSLWPEILDMETAIRYCRHIADSYDRENGQEAVSLINIQRAIRKTAVDLQKPNGERPGSEELEQRIAEILVENGYDNPMSFDKRKIRNGLFEAVRKDKRGYENPSRTRWMLAHLYPKVTKMILGNREKFNKYRYLESVLVRERVKEVSPFIEFKEAIEELLEMQDSNKEKYNSANNIRRAVNVRLSPDKIRVAPYVQLAAEIRFLLNGHGTALELEHLVGYVGEERAMQIAGEKTFYEMDDDWKDRFERFKNLSEKVGTVLQDTEDAMPKSQAA